MEKKRNNKSLVKKHEIKFSGITSKTKIDKIIKSLKKNNADALFVAQPENVCWTLNIEPMILIILPS